MNNLILSVNATITIIPLLLLLPLPDMSPANKGVARTITKHYATKLYEKDISLSV